MNARTFRPAIGLPLWADNQEGRALVQAILAEQPDYTTSYNDWSRAHWDRHYNGRSAAWLRWMRQRAAENGVRIADARFAEGEPWEVCATDLNAILMSETADELIERLVGGEQFCEVAGDPFLNRRVVG